MTTDMPMMYELDTVNVDEIHNAMLRTVADLHAAYGAGVVYEVQDASGTGECRNFVLSDGIPTTEGGNAILVGLWPDAEMTVATYAAGVLYKAVVAPDAAPILVDNVRAFLHTYGSGPR